MSVRTGAAAVLAALGLCAAAGAQSFSNKPVYLDPDLGGWVAPTRTLAFQVGCGEMYYVAGVYFGEDRALRVVSVSKLTFRRPHRRALGRYAGKLAQALAVMVEDLAGRGILDGVVLTFYTSQLQGNVLGLRIHESCLPAQAFGSLGPVPLRILDRRVEELPPP